MTWHRIDDPANPPPKDGTNVLLYSHGDYGVAFWNGRFWDMRSPQEYPCEEYWSSEAAEFGAPTDWQPLPAPPEDGE